MKDYFIELKNIFKESYKYIKENIYITPILLLNTFPIYVLILEFTK